MARHNAATHHKANSPNNMMNNGNDEHTDKRSIPEISVDTQILVKLIKTRKDAGAETITHEELSEAIKRDVQNEAYGNLNSARNIVQREHQIVLTSIRGVGYKLARNPEIIAIGSHVVTRIRRTARRGLRSMACADYDAMNNQDRIKYNAAISHVGALAAVATSRQASVIEDRVKRDAEKLPVAETLSLFTKPTK